MIKVTRAGRSWSPGSPWLPRHQAVKCSAWTVTSRRLPFPERPLLSVMKQAGGLGVFPPALCTGFNGSSSLTFSNGYVSLAYFSGLAWRAPSRRWEMWPQQGEG